MTNQTTKAAAPVKMTLTEALTAFVVHESELERAELLPLERAVSVDKLVPGTYYIARKRIYGGRYPYCYFLVKVHGVQVAHDYCTIAVSNVSRSRYGETILEEKSELTTETRKRISSDCRLHPLAFGPDFQRIEIDDSDAIPKTRFGYLETVSLPDDQVLPERFARCGAAGYPIDQTQLGIEVHSDGDRVYVVGKNSFHEHGAGFVGSQRDYAAVPSSDRWTYLSRAGVALFG